MVSTVTVLSITIESVRESTSLKSSSAVAKLLLNRELSSLHFRFLKKQVQCVRTVLTNLGVSNFTEKTIRCVREVKIALVFPYSRGSSLTLTLLK